MGTYDAKALQKFEGRFYILGFDSPRGQAALDGLVRFSIHKKHANANGSRTGLTRHYPRLYCTFRTGDQRESLYLDSENIFTAGSPLFIWKHYKQAELDGYEDDGQEQIPRDDRKALGENVLYMPPLTRLGLGSKTNDLIKKYLLSYQEMIGDAVKRLEPCRVTEHLVARSLKEIPRDLRIRAQESGIVYLLPKSKARIKTGEVPIQLNTATICWPSKDSFGKPPNQ